MCAYVLPGAHAQRSVFCCLCAHHHPRSIWCHLLHPQCFLLHDRHQGTQLVLPPLLSRALFVHVREAVEKVLLLVKELRNEFS
jgi:hypothetical protein